jgi:hypothetical protein
MASALKRYAAQLKIALEAEAAMKALRPEAKAELKSFPDKITTVDGVKFHMTQKLKKTIYPVEVQKIIDNLTERLKDQKENAEKAGVVKKQYSKTFDAELLEETA